MICQLHCFEEARTPVNSDQVLSDGDFPEESVPKDKRRVVRRCASPPGSQIVGAAQDDRECEPPLPVVDLVTGKCRPGKVSRTVSRTPLALDMTVVCTYGVVVPPPAVTSGTAVHPATVASKGIDVGTSLPVVAAPVPVVEQPAPPVGVGVPVIEFPQPLLSEPPDLLPVMAFFSFVRTLVLVFLTNAGVGRGGRLVATLFA